MTNAPWGKWKEATIVKSDAGKEIKNLKQQPGKNMVMWGSISLAQSLMKDNLIDEYQLRICPVALGKGRALFPPHINSFDMNLLDIKKYDSGLISLHYEPKIR